MIKQSLHIHVLENGIQCAHSVVLTCHSCVVTRLHAKHPQVVYVIAPVLELNEYIFVRRKALHVCLPLLVTVPPRSYQRVLWVVLSPAVRL